MICDTAHVEIRVEAELVNREASFQFAAGGEKTQRYLQNYEPVYGISLYTLGN
jgi:hypothetical protein